MVEMGQDTKMEADEQGLKQNEEQFKVAYPKNEESLVEFLHRCQRKRFEVMMCPKCSFVFDRKAEENIERVRIASKRRNWKDTHNRFTFDKRGIPRRQEQGGPGLRANKIATFKPIADAPRGRW